MMEHSAGTCLPAVTDLLEQAMRYGRSGGEATTLTGEGEPFVVAWITALEQGHGFKIVRVDPKDAEADAALAQSQRPG